MMIKKKYYVLVLFLSVIVTIQAAEENLAKFYLKKSYNFYLSHNFNLAREYLQKSYIYHNKYPEYYYISNLLLNNERSERSIRYEHALSLIDTIDNVFFISEYVMLKQALFTLESVRAYDQCTSLFKRILALSRDNLEADYKVMIEILFKMRDLSPLIPELIYDAKKLFESLDFDYYLLLYKIQTGRVTPADFKKTVNMLEANNYYLSRILYLKILYFNTKDDLAVLYQDYREIKRDDFFLPGFQFKIIHEFLQKASFLPASRISTLLVDWRQVGYIDYKTVRLLQNKYIKNVITSDKSLFKVYLNLNGMFRLDTDLDGEWEVLYTYQNNKLLKVDSDKNQDGILEYQARYDLLEKLIEYTVFEANNSVFRKFTFNHKDYSLDNIGYYRENRLYKQILLTKSTYYPRAEQLHDLDLETLLPFVSHIKRQEDGYTLRKYFNAKIEYEYIDQNRNDIYEKKLFYTNGVLTKVLNDANENWIYEMREHYTDGVLSMIEYKTDESYDSFDYREQYFPGKIVKEWDNNYDTIMEVKIEELPSGIVYKHFDINFDGTYDYIYELKDNTLVQISVIRKGVKVKLREFDRPTQERDAHKWHVVSAENLDTIEIPADIVIEDKKIMSGIYEYKDKKYLFKNGLIENDNFKYRIFYIDDAVYLFHFNE